jgi:CRP-like cAMP-binding protein
VRHAPAKGAAVNNQVASAILHKFAKDPRFTTKMRAGLEALPYSARRVTAGAMLVREGSSPQSSMVVLEGCVFRHKIVGDGRRQIFSFQIAGDFPDLQSLFLKQMDHNLSALDHALIATVPHEALRELIDRIPMVAHLLWRETLIDAAIFREWIANTGRRPAVSRMAHLFCELVSRAEVIGLAVDKTYRLDLTQAHFADAIGLSLVHVNRSLKALRDDGVIELHKGTLKILKWQTLIEIGDFDRTYLHI